MPQRDENPNRLLTLKDVRERLGLSETTIKKLKAQDRLPLVGMGSEYNPRIRACDLDEWLDMQMPSRAEFFRRKDARRRKAKARTAHKETAHAGSD